MPHLQEHGVSYFGHFRRSMRFSYISFKASIVFLIHAFIPEIFQDTGSNMILELNTFF